MALHNIGGPAKIDASTLAHILKFYGRFGDRQSQIAAYERRKAREPHLRRYGIRNLNEASAQQTRALAERGLIGAQPQTPIGSPEVEGVPNQGNVFGAGGPKIPGAMAGQDLKGGPAGGRPMVDPTAVIPQQQFTPVGNSPLAAMLAAPVRPRKRRSY